MYCKCVLRSLEVLRWNTYYKQAGTYVNLGCYILSKGHNGVLFSVFFGTVCYYGVHRCTHLDLYTRVHRRKVKDEKELEYSDA